MLRDVLKEKRCFKLVCGAGNENISEVKNMEYMFYKSTFNGDISQWDISNVTYTGGMFTECLIKEEYKPKFK